MAGMKPLEGLWEPASSCSEHGRGVGQHSLGELSSARTWLSARSPQTCSALHCSASLAWRLGGVPTQLELKDTSASHSPFVRALLHLPLSSSPFVVPLPWACPAPAHLTTQGRRASSGSSASPLATFSRFCFAQVKVIPLVNEGDILLGSLHPLLALAVTARCSPHTLCVPPLWPVCPCRGHVCVPKPWVSIICGSRSLLSAHPVRICHSSVH